MDRACMCSGSGRVVVHDDVDVAAAAVVATVVVAVGVVAVVVDLFSRNFRRSKMTRCGGKDLKFNPILFF